MINILSPNITGGRNSWKVMRNGENQMQFTYVIEIRDCLEVELLCIWQKTTEIHIFSHFVSSRCVSVEHPIHWIEKNEIEKKILFFVINLWVHIRTFYDAYFINDAYTEKFTKYGIHVQNQKESIRFWFNDSKVKWNKKMVRKIC